MKRRIFTILSALSLLLAVAFAALWVRSYWVWDHVTVTKSSTYADASSMSRGLYFKIKDAFLNLYVTDASINWTSQASMAHDKAWEEVENVTFPQYRPMGFGYGTWEIRQNMVTTHIVIIPHWFFVVVFSLLPALWLTRTSRVQLRRRRRLNKGLCPTCGYDLRASKDVCPECGAAIPAKVA